MQRSLRESLGAGCRTSIGASLGEGLRWLDRESFDLAIVRLPMPDARGLQAIVELQRSSVDLPVIALLDEGENEAVREAADSLADDCLAWEDVNAERLGQSVELALERREMLRDISRRKRAEEGWSLSWRRLQQMREERSEGARASRLGSGQKILVAEDEAVLRLAVSSATRSLGFTVVEASDGIEALELYREHGGDFLFALIDLNMPRMDGKRLLSAIRQHRKSLPVAVMSGEDDEPKAWLVENGAEYCYYLSKPFGMSGLKRMVAELKALADHRSGRPA